MKKVVRLICFIFLFMLFTKVEAADFSTYLTGSKSIEQNGTVTITVGVSNAKNLWGFMAPINYDKSKLTLTKVTGNGFGVEVGKNLVADSSTGKNGSVKVATLVFKATSNFKVGESAVISLGSVEGSDGEKTLTGTSSSIKITVAAPKNSNNNLESLSIKDHNINFNKSTLNYSLVVDNTVEKINISAIAEDKTAKVSGIGNKDLNLYSNVFEVIVTAENGSKKVYSIEVIRKDIDGNIKELSKDNTLSKLEVSGYNFIFDSSIGEYTILLKNVNKALEITADASDKNATVTINNITKYKEGNNVIEILVVAENGLEKIYKINAINLNKEEVKDNNTVFYIVIILESLIIIGGVISTVIIKKRKSNIKKS